MSALWLDWRRVLVYTHRWLGILGSLLFLAWFVSGIVLMYAGMPTLSPGNVSNACHRSTCQPSV